MNKLVWLVVSALVSILAVALILSCGDDDDDNDDNDDDEGDQECEDLIATIYDDCELTLESMSAMEAYDMCEDDAGPWDCIFACTDAFNVQSCSDFAACMADMCEVSTTGGGGGDWYDEGNSAYENCVAFYEMYYACYDVPIDESTIELACSAYEDWEDLYEDDSCMTDALEAFWECLSGLDCLEINDFTAFGNELAECAYDYADEALNCLDYDDDDDYNDDDDDDMDDCEEVMTHLYEVCGVIFVDGDGNDLSLNEAINYCRNGDPVLQCAIWCYDEDDYCDALLDCIEDMCLYYYM